MPPDEHLALPLLAGLTVAQREYLTQLFEVHDYPAGAQIFAAGERARRLYVVRSGEVVIRYRPYDGDTLDLATIQPEGAFGWSAALKRGYYTSSAVCRTPVQVLSIETRDLHQVIANDHALGEVLIERIAQMAGSRMSGLGQQVLKLLKPKRPSKKHPPAAPGG